VIISVRTLIGDAQTPSISFFRDPVLTGVLGDSGFKNEQLREYEYCRGRRSIISLYYRGERIRPIHSFGPPAPGIRKIDIPIFTMSAPNINS
jgi:hypothetical protein